MINAKVKAREACDEASAGLKSVQLDGKEQSYTTKNLIDVQALWLSRRAPLSVSVARTLAEIHFGGAA